MPQISVFPIQTVTATASRIANVPSGTISSTNVQDAINELAATGSVDWVNVKNFGAVGDGVTDDTTAIQDAIDYACDNNISTIYVPSGAYKTTSTIYLDPPDNLRTAPVDITKRINFTLALLGDESIGGGTGMESAIRPVSNTYPALVVGPGQGMVVKNFVIGPTSQLNYRANCPSLICGVGFVGGAGASRFWCEGVWVSVYHTGFRTGWRGVGDVDTVGLGDSGTFMKCRTFDCAVGIWIEESQNFINSAYDCNIEATTAVLCTNGGGLQVFGGNYSAVNGEKALLPVSAISALTASELGNAFSYTFTATVTANDFFTGPSGVYNAFVFNTAYFGPVPCTLTDFTAGTATFKILQNWVETQFGQLNDITSTTDIEAEIQACTGVYCAEMVTVFKGSQISVCGVHIENNSPPTKLLHSEATFGDTRPNHLKNVFFNTDSSQFLGGPPFTPTDANLAGFLIAHTFPFIEIVDTDTHLSDSNMGLTDLVPIAVTNAAHFYVNNVVGFRPNLYPAGGIPGGGGVSVIGDAPCMEVDKYIFFHTPIYEYDDHARGGTQVAPYWSYRPAPYSTPAISVVDFDILNGVLPALTAADGQPYPMIWGGQVYRKYSFTYATTTTYNFVSAHRWYSYGQDLTTTNVPGCSWEYKGQSSVVYLDEDSMKLMRPGLGILLDNGGGDQRYIVTGIFPLGAGGSANPLLPYITVSTDPHFTQPAQGDKNTIYTGDVIGQDPYDISEF